MTSGYAHRKNDVKVGRESRRKIAQLLVFGLLASRIVTTSSMVNF